MNHICIGAPWFWCQLQQCIL